MNKSEYIVTVGSCLAANVAHEIENLKNNFLRISSVQHNRIDQFVEIYINQIYVPLKETDLNLKVKDQYSNVNVFRNQFEDIELGKALPFNKDINSLQHPIKAIEERNISLLLIDNYPDMFFKVYKHKEKGSKFFINKAYLEEEPSEMEFINSFLDPGTAIEMYDQLITYCKSFNENLITVFIHFPINLKNSTLLAQREQGFVKGVEWLKRKHNHIFEISPREITIDDLSNPKDPYHFKKNVYIEYAIQCEAMISRKQSI